MMLIRTLAVAALFAVSAVPAHCQPAEGAPAIEGPSFGETQTWLVRALNSYGGLPRATDFQFGDFVISSDCQLSFREYSDESSMRIRLPLGAVTTVNALFSDPGQADGINIVTGQVAAVTQADRKGSFATEPEAANSVVVFLGRTPPTEAGQPLPNAPSQMVPRIINAVRHMAALCQGSYRQPEIAKEPF